MLIVFSGLPGSGKTNLANALAARLQCAVLRVDSIENAMLQAGIPRSETTGLAAYLAAEVLAETALQAGAAIIIDAVNAAKEARQAWRQIASRTGSALRVIEVICPDQAEHRRRVENRQTDLEYLPLPAWQDVCAREYSPWSDPHLTIDSMRNFVESLGKIESYVIGKSS